MSEEADIQRRIDEYLAWMEVVSLSDRTIQVRRKYLKYFREWCENRGINTIEEISRPVVERFQKSLFHYKKKDGKPLAVCSQYSRLSALKAFFKYLAQQRIIMYNPSSELQLPKLGKPIPKQTMSHEEVQQVMILCDLSNPLGIRDRAMMELFYSNGIRRAELIELNIYDIDFVRGTLMIREGKGKKDRVVPVGESTLTWLQKYLNDARPKLQVRADDITLFYTQQGERLSETYLSAHISKYISKANIHKHGSCHLFRHTAATLMLENGADIRYIQEMLGHSSIKTTEIYTRVSIKQLKNVHNLTHPTNQKSEDSKPENPPNDSS